MKDIISRKHLTSREAARLLGVSEASVKRWADAGLLRALKTAGGHRRFRPQDVAVFRRTNYARADEAGSQQQDAPTKQVASDERRRRRAPSAKHVAELQAAMFDALVGGHEEEASALLINLHLQRRTVAQIADATLCPAMQRVGELWRRGELSIAEEHLATRAALSALQTLRGALAMRDAPPPPTRGAICCSVEDDFHELPIHVATLVLEAQGWSVINLGTSTPFYALAETLTRFAPRLVCVASTVMPHPDRAAREYAEVCAAAKQAGSAVALGGAGFAGAHARQRFPADLHADSFTQLEQFAPTLYASDARDSGSSSSRTQRRTKRSREE